MTALRIPFAVLLAGLLIAAPLTQALAQSPQKAGPPEPPFMQNVFPPELVMQSAREIDLRPDQRKAITEAIQQTQSATVELQWSMQEAAADLTRAMSQERIDQKAALEAAERVMDIEGQVKRAHLALLIRIKNQLDPDQQARLKAMRNGPGR